MFTYSARSLSCHMCPVWQLGVENAQTFEVTLIPGPPRHMRITDPPNISEVTTRLVNIISPSLLCVYKKTI